MERADQVFTAGVVNPDLAADRAVNLGQERGRHHDERKSTGERCRDEAGQVADNTAAQRDDQGVAIGPSRDQVVIDLLGLGERLGGFPGRNDARRNRDSGGLERGRNSRGSRQLREIRVGNHLGCWHVGPVHDAARASRTNWPNPDVEPLLIRIS